MSSPFSTIEAFRNAIASPTEGAIYTFAHRPTINYLALLMAVGIFVWFVCRAFSTHAVTPARFDKSLNRLSSLIVVGVMSVIAAILFAEPRSPADMASAGRDVSDRTVLSDRN